ncbi:unnamed protein product [Toxocara canis]|uniref:Hexosyltransferase n=1 Tax=Toxocara canis TaxID=6265 RepID=A0A183UMN0_TOXCA|nr:unnamed protein product [Toxocara canis]
MWLAKRRRQPHFIAVLACVLLLVMLLWMIGLLDHLLEASFSEFRWPPYVNVRYQVDLELNGLLATRLYENDWAYFTAKKLPRCENNSKNVASSTNFILIVVKSSAQNLANRAAIRATWGAVREHAGYFLRAVFVVGELQPESRTKMGDVLTQESDMYGDLLIGDYVDAYRNNTLKFLSAVQLAFSYCSKSENIVPFALFVDDDYFVSVQNLVAQLKLHRPAETLYMGWRFDSSPFRSRFHKHRVSLSAYPYDRFPPYISAGAVLISRATIRDFYYGIQHVRIFEYDDIYAGIIAYHLGISPIHNPQMQFWKLANTEQYLNDLICAHGFASKRLIEFYNDFKMRKFY